jgi:hypothetical protein
MIQSLAKFILVILSICFISKTAYSDGSKEIGTARALVINKILSIDGNQHNVAKQNSIVTAKDQNGNIFYKIQSEPNSVVSTCYKIESRNKAVENKKTKIAKNQLNYNGTVNINNNGSGTLEFNDKILIADAQNNVVYIYLFY